MKLHDGDNVIGQITYTYGNKTVGASNIIYTNSDSTKHLDEASRNLVNAKIANMEANNSKHKIQKKLFRNIADAANQLSRKVGSVLHNQLLGSVIIIIIALLLIIIIAVLLRNLTPSHRRRGRKRSGGYQSRGGRRHHAKQKKTAAAAILLQVQNVEITASIMRNILLEKKILKNAKKEYSIINAISEPRKVSAKTSLISNYKHHKISFSK